MDSGDSFVIFYSNYCSHSKEFLVGLKNLRNGLFEKFTKICVDNNPSIPKAIKSVPTILVPNHEYPLTDNHVFNWLNNVGGGNLNQRVVSGEPPQSVFNQNQAEPSQPSHPPAPPKAKESEPGEISPYIACEMGNCYSDSFSFLDGDPHGGQPLAHSFTFLGADGSEVQHQQPQSRPTRQEIDRPNITNNEKSSGFDVAYEQYMSNRDADPYVSYAPKRCG